MQLTVLIHCINFDLRFTHALAHVCKPGFDTLIVQPLVTIASELFRPT